MNTNIVAHENTTMSSFDIAILTGARNSEVVSVAKTLSNKNVIDFSINHLDVMQLDKRNSLVLVANLSPEFTAAVIDRWQELESIQAPKPMSQLEMIAGMAGAMVDVERKQVEQAKALEDITSKLAKLESSDKVLTSCPANAEGITGICARMNVKYSIPAWAVKEIVRGAYGMRPAGNVQNHHESAKGSTYVVWWTSDITAAFKRIASECKQATATLVTHADVSKRFKLIK